MHAVIKEQRNKKKYIQVREGNRIKTIKVRMMETFRQEDSKGRQINGSLYRRKKILFLFKSISWFRS